MLNQAKKKDIILSLPEELHARLKIKAIYERTTMKEQGLKAIERWVTESTNENKPVFLEHLNEEELNPEFLKELKEAEKEIKEGKTISLEEFLEKNKL